MKLFIRFTETPFADIKRGYSHHFYGSDPSFVENLDNVEWVDELGQYAEELDGLCAYGLDSENIEDALEEIKEIREESNFKDCFNWDTDSWCILSGEHVDFCPEGCIIKAGEILHINKSKYFAE